MVSVPNSRLYHCCIPWQRYIPWQPKEELEHDGFPQRLSTMRQERNLKQQAFADMVGLGITQMKRYEAGTSQPTLEVIWKLSQALRVSADELLFGKTEPGPDEDLRLHFEAISRFSEGEKKVVRSVLEGLAGMPPRLQRRTRDERARTRPRVD